MQGKTPNQERPRNMMFVLLQIYRPEAADHEDGCCCLDVITVAPTEAELERYLAAYKRRYRAAVQAFNAWGNMSGNWGPQHDSTCAELLRRYELYGSLISGTKFKIVQCLSSGRPSRDEELKSVVSPANYA